MAKLKAENKNPTQRALMKQIQNDNYKMLKSFHEIHRGKQLAVATHAPKIEKYQTISLNFSRMKENAMSIDSDNTRLLRALHHSKTGVPSNQKLQKDWNKKMNYTKILKKKNS